MAKLPSGNEAQQNCCPVEALLANSILIILLSAAINLLSFILISSNSFDKVSIVFVTLIL